jgi:hypothetical protein
MLLGNVDHIIDGCISWVYQKGGMEGGRRRRHECMAWLSALCLLLGSKFGVWHRLQGLISQVCPYPNLVQLGDGKVKVQQHGSQMHGYSGRNKCA